LSTYKSEPTSQNASIDDNPLNSLDRPYEPIDLVFYERTSKLGRHIKKSN